MRLVALRNIGNFKEIQISGTPLPLVATAWQGECVAHTPEPTVEQDPREIDTPKGALRYYDCGPNSGPTLLFLHGSGPGVTGWRNFRGVIPTFAEHYRCLVLEFPGFGVSPDFGGHPMVTAHGAVVPFLD